MLDAQVGAETFPAAKTTQDGARRVLAAVGQETDVHIIWRQDRRVSPQLLRSGPDQCGTGHDETHSPL